MFQKLKKRFRKNERAFTLIELLVVIALIAILAAVIIAVLSTSRARAEDAQTKEVLSTVRSDAEEEKHDTGSYTNICTSSAVTSLASSKNLQSGEYNCSATADEYAVVFPMKAENGYWCIDSTGAAVLVGSLTFTGSTFACSALPSAQPTGMTGSTPSIVLLGDNPDPTPFPEPMQYTDPGYIASDPEDGDISNQVMVLHEALEVNPGQYCSPRYVKRTYTVTDSDGNQAQAIRTAYNMTAQPNCAPPPGDLDDMNPIGPPGVLPPDTNNPVSPPVSSGDGDN